ncbi:MAG: biotin synthase BioB [Nitrospirae bacterium]|nr:biotin synthase BioB [Nitrospirota bacterium]
MTNIIAHIGENVLLNKGITRDEALSILNLEYKYLPHLMSWTDRVRQTFNGNTVNICSVINARSGGCPEDCSFCSQSVYSSADITSYPLLPIDTVIEGARTAKANGATKFCLATSGNGIGSKKELDKICEFISRITNEVGINVCATLGSMTKDEMTALKSAGLARFHHNLETAEAFFPEVCTTHTYKDRIEQVRLAKNLGLSICSGGIFGIGETIEHRVDLALAIRELDVDSVPINFLMPIQGNPISNEKSMSGVLPKDDKNPPLFSRGGMGGSFSNGKNITPWDALRIIALFRFVMPDKEIRICGGRTTALRELHPFIFSCGANGMMIGNYLTNGGREPGKDLQMLSDLGLKIETLTSVI